METKAKAEAEDAEAQPNLGVMYEKGKGVPVDFIAAYAWGNITAASGGSFVCRVES